MEFRELTFSETDLPVFQRPDAFLGALGGRFTMPELRAGAHRSLCVEGLHKKGRDPNEALPLRLRHPSSKGKGGLLLLEDSKRSQDRSRGVGGCEGGTARPGAPGARANAYLEAEKEKAGKDPEKEAQALTNRIAEADRKRAAYQDLVADGL